MIPLAVSLHDWLRAVVPHELKVYYWAAQYIYLNPWFWGFTLSIFCLERWRPAVPTQRVFSLGLAQDFVWFNVDAVIKVAALPAFISLLKLLYDSTTGGYTVSAFGGWPLAAKVILAIAAFDFLQWFHHWVRHKVKAFWHFHAIHHAQRELNVFTELRVHTGEYLIAETLVFIPMFAFGLPALAVMGVGSIRWWYTRFIHANIRTNLGPLKYVLVTPQSHRVHHSIEARHQDKNFGVVLSVWDRMFGTLHANYDEYPATGVAGLDFEPPHRIAPAAWARDYLRMFVYPFRALAGHAPKAVTEDAATVRPRVGETVRG
ncbi:MAG: sterol desaturase family protein [Gemmatimonadaceae bacterium]